MFASGGANGTAAACAIPPFHSDSWRARMGAWRNTRVRTLHPYLPPYTQAVSSSMLYFTHVLIACMHNAL